MNPKVWGDSGWVVLYTIANGYPQNPTPRDIHHYIQFYRYIQHVLPCHACSVHYGGHLKSIPIDPYLGSRDNLLTWVNRVHNTVCNQLGKKPVPRDQIDHKYLLRGREKWHHYWWKFMFSVSYAYPEKPKMDDMYHYQRFFIALQYVLPLKKDRDLYARILTTNPINAYLISPKYLTQWLIDTHNHFTIRHLQSEKQAYTVYFDKPDRELQYPPRTGKVWLVDYFSDKEGQNQDLRAKNVSLGVILIMMYLLNRGWRRK